MSWQRIELNMIPDTKVLPVVHASQFDSNRSISFQMFTGEDEWTIPEGLTIELHCRKVDDNIVTLAPLSVDGSVITFITNEQLTACSGQNKCELSFIDADDLVIGSLNFILDVEPDPLKGGLTSASSIYDLTQQIEDIAEEVIGEDYYNKTETDALLADKADKSEIPDMDDYYNKVQTDALLADKADVSDLPDMSNYYTKPETNGLISALANQVNNKFDDIMPVGSASGNPCTFDTDYPYLIQGLKAEIVCGGGGGTPSTPIPLVGHSELNIDIGIDNFLNETTFSQGSIDAATGVEIASPYRVRSNYIWLEEGNYLISSPNGFDIVADIYDENKSYKLSESYTSWASTPRKISISSGGRYARVLFRKPNNSSIIPSEISGELLTKITNTFTVAFGQTVYGGVYDKSGRLTITHGIKDLGTLNYNYDGDTPRFWTNEITDIKHPSNNAIAINGLADIYKVVSFDDLYYRYKENGTIACSAAGVVSIINTAYTDAPAFKTAMSGHYLCYELATPIIIDVRSINFVTEDGTNTITSDCNGDVTAYYKDSIQHYIDTRS